MAILSWVVGGGDDIQEIARADAAAAERGDIIVQLLNIKAAAGGAVRGYYS